MRDRLSIKRGDGTRLLSDPEIAGTFVYHCHVLDHEDGGMMAEIQVKSVIVGV